jgi:hypothetical protein
MERFHEMLIYQAGIEGGGSPGGRRTGQCGDANCTRSPGLPSGRLHLHFFLALDRLANFF